MEAAGNFDRFSIEEDDDDLDDDVFSSGTMSFNGRLVISGEPLVFPVLGVAGRGIVYAPEDNSSDCEGDEETDDSISRGQGITVTTDPLNVKFEVFTTRICEFQRKQCVFYSLMVLKTEGIDTDKAIIERRYSDFAALYKGLKKDHPKLLENVAFPGKVFGQKSNLSSEVIESRCRAFEVFLQKIYHHKAVCLHPAFRELFYLPELREATEKLRGGELKSSLKLLLNSLHLQVKLCDQVREIIATLGAIVVIHEAQSKFEEAERYATAAIELVQGDYFCPYVIPLLDTAANLRWKLQKDKKTIERHLTRVQRMSGLEVDQVFTLRELSVSRFDK